MSSVSNYFLFFFFSFSQGVIFNLHFHGNKNQLSTVSDDRSIRLWSLDGSSSKAVLVLYGHTARVWDCQLLDDVIVSVGEVRPSVGDIQPWLSY